MILSYRISLSMCIIIMMISLDLQPNGHQIVCYNVISDGDASDDLKGYRLQFYPTSKRNIRHPAVIPISKQRPDTNEGASCNSNLQMCKIQHYAGGYPPLSFP